MRDTFVGEGTIMGGERGVELGREWGAVVAVVFGGGQVSAQPGVEGRTVFAERDDGGREFVIGERGEELDLSEAGGEKQVAELGLRVSEAA